MDNNSNTQINTPSPLPPLQQTVNAGNVAGMNASKITGIPYTPNTNNYSNVQTNQPTISASTLTNNTPLNLPAQTNTNTQSASNNAIGASQGALLGLTSSSLNNATENYNSSKEDVIGSINQYLNKGTDQLNMENAAGVPQLQATANSFNNQYLTQSAAYNSQYNAILNRVGGTAETKAAEISALQQQHGYDLTDTAIKASIASTNYTNAENIISHQIDLKYAPLKDAIDYGMQFLSQNKDILTQQQQNDFAAKLQVQTQTYTQGVYNDHLLSDTKVQMIKDAAANGAPSDVQQAIWNAPDIGTAASAGGQYTANGNYTPVQTGYDPNTGLPIYSGFNQKTGQLEVKNPRGILGQTGSDQTTVTGADGTSYQMGATTTLGAYAKATQTQVNNITATVAKINSSVGTVTDAKSAQFAINTINQNSPITGQMVMNAATKYGVDPATLIGVMNAETQLGTDGSKGAIGNNFGNVGNTDSLMKAGGSISMKPQEGVDAVAKCLAQRQVQSGQNDPAQPTPTQNLTPQQVAQQSIKNAPAFIQPAMNTSVTTGGVFIDQSKIPKGMEIVATNYASKTGIPILNSDQVSVVNGADEAIRNINEVIAPAWQDIAPNGTVGKLGLQTYSLVGGILDTDKNAKIKTFLSNRENVAQQIRALSQSAPKGSLLSTAEAALPDLSGYGFHIGALVGASGGMDSMKVGNAKLQRTLDLLNQTIKTFLPNATPATLSTTTQASNTSQPYNVNGVIYYPQSDGTYATSTPNK